MRKAAIFVEGMTEQEFVVAIIKAIAGNKIHHIDKGVQFRGKVQISGNNIANSTKFYFLVVDCTNDEQVKTQIKEQYPSLAKAGYTSIIGLRDVYPKARADIPRIQAGLNAGLPNNPITPEMHLAVMETEAWFLHETTHFQRIHPSLTVPHIVSNGYDITSKLGTSWEHPAEVLDNIYKLANARYMTPQGRKIKRRIRRTIDALSIDELYFTGRNQLSDFDQFLTSLEKTIYA